MKSSSVWQVLLNTYIKYMDNIKIKGALHRYLRFPLYFLLLNILIEIALCMYYPKLGMYGVGFIALYSIAFFAYRNSLNKKLAPELIAFAMQYGTVQKEILDKLQLEYAIVDKSGHILWANSRFQELIADGDDNLNSIFEYFEEIKKDIFEKIEAEEIVIPVFCKEKYYSAVIQKLKIENFNKNNSLIESDTDEIESLLYSIMFFDETEYKTVLKEYDEDKLVVGLVYIDNYDETIDTVEDVKQSLLSAVVERKIQRYFSEADAIIRKLEKDRFFVVFRKKYLSKLQENKFSILEDIKTAKVSNDIEITLSIGIGLGGDSYQQNMEFSRMALGLALGRGGAQAVVKNSGDVVYYGGHGKEFEKNTRVKARVKAQALRELMNSREKILVMGHALTDFDAFGAGIGIYCAARELGKPCHIVLNTVTRSIRPIVETFTEDEKYPDDLFIDSNRAMEIISDKVLTIVVDTNRPSYTECPGLLEQKATVVFDHHRQGKEQIANPLLSYIETYASSTCEIIAEILQYFSEKMHLNPKEADCLYAGMLIDTNNFMTKTGVRTFEAAAYLRRNGAEVTRVRKLLREDMDAYKARAEIVRQAVVYRNTFAFSICKAGELESPTIVGAQAANELLNIVGIKASFVLTEYNNKIYVSSRSIDEIDVQLIMERIGGGGHLNMAGAQLDEETLESVQKKIRDILDDMIEKGEIEI